MIRLLIIATLAGCATTAPPQRLETLIMVEDKRPFDVRRDEVDRYVCIGSRMQCAAADRMRLLCRCP